MREFSKVYSNLWQSQKFMALASDFERLVYVYLLTSPHSNSAGCYDLKPGYACADLNCDRIAYGKAMDSLCNAMLIEMQEGCNTVLITNWVQFNEPTNAKHSLGILTQLDGVSSERLKSKRGQEFVEIIDAKKHCFDRSCGAALDRVCEAYRKPIERVSSPRPETESRDLDQDQTRPRLERREEVSREPSQDAALKGVLPLAQGKGQAVHYLLETQLMKRTS